VTPLVATTEFNVTVTSANGTITWATRSFDEGMKNQNCEARFSYRGFQATSKAQIKQGANVVAELTLTPSATDPRIASINFPCGDLSAATTFVITDSATLSGVHEIGGIYVGLATNQANVAQAEVVVSARYDGQGGYAQTIPSGSNTRIIWNVENTDVLGEYDISTGIFTAKRSGQYKIETMLFWQSASYSASSVVEIKLLKNGGLTGYDQWRHRHTFPVTQTLFPQNMLVAETNLNVGDTLELVATQSTGTDKQIYTGTPDWSQFTITRLPSSSELVVTPETQNVWGGARYFGTTLFENKFSGSAADPNTYVAFGTGSGALNWSTARTLFGKGLAPSTNSQLLGVKLANLPVGSYMVTIRGDFKPSYPTSNSGWYSVCGFDIYENNTATSISRNNGIMDSTPGSPLVFSGKYSTLRGVYNNTSVGDREFVLRASKTQDSTSGSLATCAAASSSSSSGTPSEVSIDVTPLDNNSNSALYVQGPVKAAETGTAIPTGYVGETNSSAAINTVATPSGNWIFASSGVTLQPGVYLVSHWCTWPYPGGNQAFSCMVSTDGTTYGAIWGDQTWNQVTWVAGALPHAITIAPKVVRVTTPTLLYFGAVQIGVTSNTATHRLEVLRIN
jgi:hypothetical protein